jgi:TonB family protein
VLKHFVLLSLVGVLGASPPPGPSAAIANDYPLTAYRNHEQGIVVFDVTIGTDGRVHDCKIVASPNSRSLERATCTIVTRRGVFTPKLDKDGQPTEFKLRSAVRWVIPGCKPPKQSIPKLNSLGDRIVTVTSAEHC